jgi:hypothetical protein
MTDSYTDERKLLMKKSKPELIVLAKSLELRSIQNNKKEVIVALILEKSGVALPVVAAPVVAAPVVAAPVVAAPVVAAPVVTAPVVKAEPFVPKVQTSAASDNGSTGSEKKVLIPSVWTDSFDQKKLRFVFQFLKPRASISEWVLLRMMFGVSPESFILNGGHINPTGDTIPHYTITVSQTLPDNYILRSHYHLRYERTPSGKEKYTELTNRHREIIADFRSFA